MTKKQPPPSPSSSLSFTVEGSRGRRCSHTVVLDAKLLDIRAG